MSNLMNYGVSLNFQNFRNTLTRISRATAQFNNAQVTALNRQITLQRRLNSLRGGSGGSGGGGSGGSGGGGNSNNTPNPNPNQIGPSVDRNTQRMLQRRAALERRRQQQAQTAAERLASAERRRIRALEQARESIASSAFMQRQATTAAERQTQAAIRNSMQTARTARELRNAYRLHVNSTAQLRQQSFLMRRMQQSSEQMAGNFLSIYAAASGIAEITRIGQQFESVSNTMLAVSESSEAAGNNLKFVKDEAFRLGLGLKESSKQYAKMVAAQGEMSDQNLKEVFLGTAEMSTVLGLSADESGRAFTALTQIMGKGQVMAEELKGQLGEVLPNAIQLMAKAAQDAGISTDGSVKSLMKLMQEGKVMANDVMPHFAKRMREAAAPGLEQAMNSNRVAMNRMITTVQMAADAIFKSGYSEGLTDLFNNIASMIKDSGALWEGLGKILGSVFKGIAWLVKHLISPALSALGSIVNAVATGLGDFAGVILVVGAAVSPLGKIFARIFGFLSRGRGTVDTLGRAFSLLVAPLMLVLGALEEIAEFFNPTGKKTLIGTNLNDFKEELAPITETVAYIKRAFTEQQPKRDVIPEDYVDFQNKIRNWMGLDNVKSSISNNNQQQRMQSTPTARRYGTYAYGNNAEQKVTVTVPVVLDGNTIAEVVAETSPMKDSIDRSIGNAMAGNYN